MKKFLVLVMLLLLSPVVVYGANKKDKKEEKPKNAISLTCDKVEKINVNEQIICRVSTTAAFYYNRISFNIDNTDGIEIVDVRSNYNERWKIEKDGKGKITAISDSVQSDLQEFGIILIKAVKDGREDLNIDNVILENTVDEEEIKTLELDAITQTFQIVSSDNTLKSIKLNDEPLRGFNKDNTKYYIVINDRTELKVEAESNNEYATIKGTGDIKLDSKINNFVIPITVLSEDGSSKIYTLYLNRNENKEVRGLDSLNIKNDRNNTLLISFNSEVGEYYIDVDNNTKSLTIKPILSEGYKFIKGYGEQKIELLSGNNLVLIKVEDKDSNQYTYVLNITKPIAGKSSNNFIKTLLIKDHKLNFSKRVKNYTLYVEEGTTSLEITPILESATSRYVISGNENLKDGSVIKIEVTAENEEKTTYKINIKTKHTSHSVLIFIIIGGLLIVGAGIKFKDKLVSLFKIEGKDKDKIKEQAVTVIKEAIVDVVKDVIPAEEKTTTTQTKTTTTKKKTNNKKKNYNYNKKKNNNNKKTNNNNKNTTKKNNTNNAKKTSNNQAKKNNTAKKTNNTKKTNNQKKTTTTKKTNNNKKTTTKKTTTKKSNSKKK